MKMVWWDLSNYIWDNITSMDFSYIPMNAIAGFILYYGRDYILGRYLKDV
jgi:hypothetical protein